MQKLVLVLNCGSSSIKFATLDPASGDNCFSGLVQCIATGDANISWRKHEESKQKKDLPNISYQAALEFILDLLRQDAVLTEKIVAIGHRVVHGGERFTQSVLLDATVLDAIRDCQNLAPLHNPANIQGIEAAQKAFPDLPQAAVFDTAFHQTMPEHAYLYAIPHKLYKEYKIRRYGFHGTSHRFVSEKAAKLLNKPYDKCAFITAHLGNGCSACAILNGKSLDTSMGLTPLEGLVMGTRSGDVDPSLHAHLADSIGYDIHKVNKLLNKESGLLGISETSSDMRGIEEAAEKGDKKALLAAEIFCYRLAKYIAAYAVPLGRIDALIFTGGIGENSPYIRGKTLKWLTVLNFAVDTSANENHGVDNKGIITENGSTVAMVIPTNEELLIAQDTVSLAQ